MLRPGGNGGVRVKRILVLCDDLRRQETVGEILEPEGYDVMTVAWDPLALGLVLTANPELVILDICLPEASGQDYCRQIRSRNAAVPLLVLSAIKDVANVIQLLELGADDYITKPFCAPEFTARVKASMRLRAVRNRKSAV
jgi:DNA-binding response OmpR family regulator